MAIQYESPKGSILAPVALVQFRLVKYDGNYCAVSTIRNHAGITQEQVASGARVTLKKPGCTFSDKVEAAAAIGAGVPIYYDTNGRVGTTSASNTQVGISLTAASGAGSIIEALFFG